MADSKTTLQIVLEANTKEAKEIVKAFQEISQKGKTTEKRLQAVKKANDDLTISFKRLFQIVILYVGAFETLHKVLNVTGDSIATMVNYNRQLENMMYGLATTLTMVSDVKIGDRVLRGFEEFNFQLQIANNLLELMREKSMQAFVPLESTFETFRAIVGFVLQSGGELEDAVDLAIKGSQAIQALSLPMNQVVQEMRDLLQGGIQPASSTLAMILGINDTLINQWKEQGILLDMLKEKFKDLEYTMSEKFKTLEGKIFVITEFFKRALGEGGKPLYEGFKTVLDDLIKALFNVERKTVKVGETFKEVFKITPKTEFLNIIRSIADGLREALYITYAFGKTLSEFVYNNQELIKTILKIIGYFILYKTVLFSVKILYHSFSSVISSTLGVFIKLFNIFKHFSPLLTSFVSFLKISIAKWILFINIISSSYNVLSSVHSMINKIVSSLGVLSIIMEKTAVKWIALISALATFVALIVKFSNVVEYLKDIISGRKSFEDIKNDIINFGKDVIKSIKKPFEYIHQEIFGKYQENLRKLKESQLKSLRETIGFAKGKYELIYTGETPQDAEKLKEELRNIVDAYLMADEVLIEWIKYQNEGKITLQKTIEVKENYLKMLKSLIEWENFHKMELKDKMSVIKEYNKTLEELERLKQMKKLYELEKRYYETDIGTIGKTPTKEYFKEKMSIIEERIRFYEEEKRKLTEVNEKYLELVRTLRQLYQEKQKLKEEYREWFGTIEEGFNEAIIKIKREYNEFALGIKMTSQFINETFRFLTDSLYKFLTFQLRSFKDFVREFANIVTRLLTELLTRFMMAKIINFIPIPTAHTGGLVKKYHYGGLASDEVPAILQTGEYVISRKGVEFLDKINRGQLPYQPSQPTVVIVNYNINAIDSRSFEEYVRANKGAIIKPIIEDINRNGVFIKTIRNKF